MAAPRTITIPALKKQTASIICLHGLGDSGAGWSFLADQFRRKGKFEDVSFIFPSAPPIPISVNFGMSMPGWYDIIDFDSINRSEDEPGILRSRTQVHAIIKEQIEKGIPANRIVLGGFSQGGAMSLFAGLTYPERLAGVFGLSCYQVLPKKFDELRTTEAKDADKPMVFMGHGEDDPLVKFAWGKETAKGLEQRGFELDFKSYPGLEHGADPKELDDLEAWVERRLRVREEL